MDIEWSREKLTRYVDPIRPGFVDRVNAEYVDLMNGTGSVRAFSTEASNGTSDSARRLSRVEILATPGQLPPVQERSLPVNGVAALNEICDQWEQQLLATRSIHWDLGAPADMYVAPRDQGGAAA